MMRGFAQNFALASFAWSISSAAVFAQGLPLGQMYCETEVENYRINGQVYASLWNSPNYGNTTPAGYRQMYYFLMTGKGHLIPGTVQLFADLRNNFQQVINFEVFLTGGNQGTGAFWIDGSSHRQTYMRLVLQEGGFTIVTEDGIQAQYRCQETPNGASQ